MWHLGRLRPKRNRDTLRSLNQQGNSRICAGNQIVCFLVSMEICVSCWRQNVKLFVETITLLFPHEFRVEQRHCYAEKSRVLCPSLDRKFIRLHQCDPLSFKFTTFISDLWGKPVVLLCLYLEWHGGGKNGKNNYGLAVLETLFAELF